MITSNLNRREWLKRAAGTRRWPASALTSRAAIAAGSRPRQAAIGNSVYSNYVLSLRPVGYWRLGETNAPTAFDWSGLQNNGIYRGSPAFGQPGAIRNDANTAIGLDGRSYVEIPSRSDFSIGPSGLTVQAWLRPDVLNFPCAPARNTSTGLVKATPGPSSGDFAFTRKTRAAPTESPRTSGMPKAAKEPVLISRNRSSRATWINVVAVYQPPGNNAGVAIYRNGVLKNGPPKPPTLYRSYGVTPRPGGAPVRLGCRDLTSFLRGGLDEVAIYPRCLTAAEILKNYPARHFDPPIRLERSSTNDRLTGKRSISDPKVSRPRPKLDSRRNPLPKAHLV